MTSNIAWALGLVGAILIREIYTHVPAISRWIILREAAKLPSHVRDRHAEEWLQGNEAKTGSLLQLIDALGYIASSTADETAREIRDSELSNIDAELARCASLQATNVTLLDQIIELMVESEGSAETARTRACSVKAEIRATIDKAKHGQSLQVIATLQDAQIKCDDFLGYLQQSVSVVHANTREALSSAALGIEEHGRLVNAAAVKRAIIAELLERTQGYPEDVARGIEEIRDALALITAESGDPKVDSKAEARRAQSLAICNAIQKLVASIN